MTPAQNMTALRQANRIRLARAQLKRDLHAGKISLAMALDHPVTQGAPVEQIIGAQYMWGRARTLKLLRDTQITEGRLIRTIPPRQRTELCKFSLLAPNQRHRKW